jgi:cell fate regulator YaaT (PSP1 superfamily)
LITCRPSIGCLVEKSDRGPYVSVRLGPVSRTQTFLLDNIAHQPRPGDAIVIRTEQGTTLATVVPTVTAVAPRRALPSKNVFVRHATDDDRAARLRQQRREEEARRSALVLIRQLKLDMKLSRVEQMFDGGRLIFYFTAEGRIDFRELVRLLAAEFRTRIEMRQIGVRDEARMIGGYGSCGRPLCCTSWLQTFEPVSIRMAKQQDLALNPSKLSGLCGRLKCCLRYELPNAKGELRGGCGDEGTCNNPSGCGTGGCGSGTCTCHK